MFADDIFNEYQSMYQGITEEQWQNMAETNNITSDIFKRIFQIKDDEKEQLDDFIEGWLAEYPVLYDFFEQMGDESVLDDIPIQEIFFSAMGKLIEDRGIQELIDDEHDAYWTCILADVILMNIYDQIFTILSAP